MARVLRKLSFADFLQVILNDTEIVASVGKSAKQIKDADGKPLLMLNIFAHTLQVHLASWSVQGDKTNEPGCLKQHLGELFDLFPCLKLLTSDAIYAQRPLLKAIQEYHRDYLVQVKENLPKHVCGEDWDKAWTILTSMAVSVAKLMKKDERTLKEVRKRSDAKPEETALILGYRKNLLAD